MMWFGHEITDVETVGQISIHRKAEDVPRMGRVYRAQVTESIRIEVDLHSYSFCRCDYSTLTQGNGKWISFDVKVPADKIIDRDLIGPVQALCSEILRLDAEFVKSHPNDFVDEKGQRWVRA